MLKVIAVGTAIAAIAAADTSTNPHTSSTSIRRTTTCNAHGDYWACGTTFTVKLCGTPLPTLRYPPVVPTEVADRCSSLSIALPPGWSTAYPETTIAPSTTEAVSSTTTSIPVAITDPPPGAPLLPLWRQCGGIGWTGNTVCAVPAECKTLNPYYAQCL